MALPVSKADPVPETKQCIFRTVRGEDGELRIVQLPATLETLLDPRLEDQVTQSNRHLKTLLPLLDVLKRNLERLAPNLAVFSDLMLLYKRHGYRNVTPDIAVVEGLAERDAVDESLDVIAEGGRLRLVLEVVSTGDADMRRKDEEINPKLFADLGVEDYVLVYPPKRNAPLQVVTQRLSSAGGYVTNPPDGQGRILLASVDLWLWVNEEDGGLELIHRETGERLLTSAEEEAACREEKAARQEAERRAKAAERRVAEAERRVTENLVMILESRGFAVTRADRRRILHCRDPDQLQLWTQRAFSVESVGELWGDGTQQA